MKNSINKFENLSIEILLEIFDYLSITDCFNGFQHLNWNINSALKLTGLSIDLTSISLQKYNKFYEKIIFLNHYKQIRKFKISNDLTIDLIERFFNKFNLRDFKQLRSLILIKPSYMTLSSLALFIPHLKQLEHISIDTNVYPNNFFQTITTKSLSIKSCYLPRLEIQDELIFQSNIKYLTITVEDITILLNLLAVFSQLKYLNVTVKSTLYLDENSLLKLNPIVCQNLQIFRLNLLQQSCIDFDEIKYFFQQIKFHQLISFSYYCTTNSLNHIDVIRWNEILTKYLSTIEKLNFFVQIPLDLYSYNDIKQIQNDLQTNLCYSTSFSLSIDFLYYIIHTDIYPKNYFILSSEISDSNQYFNYDPLNCNTEKQFSKVNSLILYNHSITPCTILSKNIKHLQIRGQNDNNNINLNNCLQYCSNQLLSLNIFDLPNNLLPMPNLRELTIQQVMFNLNMAMKLSILCPRLELLTIEIDCIKQFRELLDQLRYKSNLIQLKFIRAFSRDTTQTWSSWLSETNQLGDNINYDVKSLFLFLWL